jgi:septal ring factor EnvC (AmiA/AmiB activator)
MDVKQLMQLKQDIEAKEKKITMLRGELKSKQKQLAEMGFDSVKDAQKQIDEYKRVIGELEDDFDAICDQIEDMLE